MLDLGSMASQRRVNDSAGSIIVPDSAPHLVLKLAGGFLDESPKNHTLTIPSRVLKYSASRRSGTGSYFMSSVPNAVESIKVSVDSDFNLGTGDFCIEAWMYKFSLSTVGILGLWASDSNNASNFRFTTVSEQTIRFGANSNTLLLTSSVVPTSFLNRWTHVAASRFGSTFRLFVDGVQRGSLVSAASIGFTPSYICSTGHNIFGFLDDIKIHKGFAKYTTDFTV